MLRVENLSFSFDQNLLFSQISFELLPGQVLQIAGPNGAGKSTLLSMLAGLLRPKTGSFSYFDSQGKKIASFQDEIAYLSADVDGHFLDLSASDNLRFWLSLRGLDASQQNLQQILSAWGLKTSYLRESLALKFFSTGLRRRLAMARVSALAAPFWLLDEPLLGLDRRGIATFYEILAKHLAAGHSALLIAHDWDAKMLRPTAVLNLGEGEV